MSEKAALGLAVHTGWAAAVVVAGSLRKPQILAREEIAILGDADRFAFHMAAKMERAAAERSVARARKEAAASAAKALAAIVARLREGGTTVVACAVVANAGAAPSSLDEALSSHMKIHGAEGMLYRDVLRASAEAAGVAARVIAPRTLDATAAKALRIPIADLSTLLAAAGRSAGRPWSKDQRLAALAAWTVLSAPAT